MTPNDILSHTPKILTQEQRQCYFDKGYLLLEGFLSDNWLARLREVTDRFVDEARGWTQSDDKFDLESGHSAKVPRLRRLTQPVAHHPLYWELASDSPITDVAEDLLGPDVAFHHSKLNFKWSGGGTEVKWHQDIPFYPHTNCSVLAIGLYLEDVTQDMGPMAVIPGSHKGEVFSHYNDQDKWIGALADTDAARLPVDTAVPLAGPAGSVTVHHGRAVHGSEPNLSSRGRPLLINAYSSADALTITPYSTECRYSGQIVRGNPARWAHFDGGRWRMPPDASSGHRSIFALQQDDEAAARAS